MNSNDFIDAAAALLLSNDVAKVSTELLRRVTERSPNSGTTITALTMDSAAIAVSMGDTPEEVRAIAELIHNVVEQTVRRRLKMLPGGAHQVEPTSTTVH